MQLTNAFIAWIGDPINLTAISTAVIAGFTVALVWVSYCQARLIGKSIKLARDEFNATHRPRIRVHAAEFKRIPAPASADKNDVSDRLGASLVCFNIGASTAVKIEVRGQIFAGANFALDVQRPLIKAFDNVVSGGKFRADIDSDVPISTVAASKRTGIEYHCIGWVAYWDANGLRRESGFLYRADAAAKSRECWVRILNQDYNYDY